MEVCKTSKRATIKELFLCKNYTLLLIGNFISRFGDSVDSIAYGWMVYMLTGSKVLLGTIMAVNAIPNIVFGPFAGVFADRLNKKKLIVLSFIGRGLIVSVIAVLFMLKMLKPWHLFIFTILTSILETLMSPAVTSMMTIILEKDQFLSANSFSSSAYRFAELIGTASAGVIITLAGISGAIFVDAVTFFIASVIMSFIKGNFQDGKKEKINVKSYFKDLKVGFDYVKQNKLIRVIIFLFAIINFCLSPIGVLIPILTNEILKSGPEILSVIGAMLSLGMILGGLIVAQFGSKFKMTSLIIWGFIILGLDYSLLYLPGNVMGVGVFSTSLTVFCFFMFGVIVLLSIGLKYSKLLES